MARHWLLAPKAVQVRQNGVLKIVLDREEHRIILTRRDGIRNAGD